MQSVLEPLKRALLDGTPTVESIAVSVRRIEPLWDEVLNLVRTQISCECGYLCQKLPATSLLRNMSISDMEHIKWTSIVAEIKRLAPTLLDLLMTVVSHNDHRYYYAQINAITMFIFCPSVMN